MEGCGEMMITTDFLKSPVLKGQRSKDNLWPLLANIFDHLMELILIFFFSFQAF